MVMVKVLSPFYDLVEKVDRQAGDSFEATDDRAKHLLDVLGDAYVEIGTPNLGGLTKQQLVELAAERGIEVPKQATKAQVIELLEG